MGLYDTMKQMGTPASGAPVGANSMGQGFAQQVQPMQQDAFKQKMQQRANPMMRARPAMSGGFNQQNSMSQTPNPMTGQRPMMNSLAKSAGQMGSRPDVMQRQESLAQQQQQSQGLGPSIPQYQQLQQTLSKQKGLQTPYDSQQQEALQAQQQAAANPLQAASEQMRGYDGPDLGSRDPRELAKTGMSQLYGQQPINQVPELPMGRPDVMPRNGIGPSAQLFDGQQMFGGMAEGQTPYGQPMMPGPVQMDENGLEPRRGAR